jgi:DNA gyrase/topoisomerase IV subunit A
VVDVVREADGDATLCRRREGARDELRGRLLEIEVVEGEVERLSRRRDELTGVLGDLERALAAVRQCPDVERQAYPLARRTEMATLATARPTSPPIVTRSRRP